MARIINDKWDAVWEMPMTTFLVLVSYRRDKADYELARAQEAQRRARQRNSF